MATVVPSSGQIHHDAMSGRVRSNDIQLVSLLFKTRAGVTLNYVEQGEQNGPVIVLLHGAGDSWHSFDRVYPLIPPQYHVYAITLRGHGLSDHPADGFSTADFAADVEDFLAQQNLRHVTLVGHSLGSFVAQKVAEDDADHRLMKLVLIGSGPGVQKSSDSAESVLSAFANLHDPIPFTFARDFQASTIYYPVPAKNFEIWVAEAERVPAATWHGLAHGHRESVDTLKEIQVPTLALWGENDSIFKRADQEVLIHTIPHARLSTFPQTGHALHWERPERFTKELLAFVDSK